MRRNEFEHVIAAAANAVGEDDIVVIGSQAILGPFPDAPSPLLRSMEADVYPRDDPARADLIDGALGDGSPFHEAFGYYAHGVGPETAKAPRGWQGRLIAVPIEPRLRSARRPIAWCLAPHDLVLAKSAAGRQRDWDFAGEAIRAGCVDRDRLLELAPLLPVADETKAHVDAALRGTPRGPASTRRRVGQPAVAGEARLGAVGSMMPFAVMSPSSCPPASQSSRRRTDPGPW